MGKKKPVLKAVEASAPEAPKEIEYPEIYVTCLADFQEHFKKVHNPLERMMACNLLLLDLPFYYQYKVELGGGWVVNGRKYFVVDFYVPGAELIIETDGKVHQDVDQMEKDRCKDNALAAKGFKVMRFTWDEVMRGNSNFDINHYVSDACIDDCDTMTALESEGRDMACWECKKATGRDEVKGQE